MIKTVLAKDEGWKKQQTTLENREEGGKGTSGVRRL